MGIVAAALLFAAALPPAPNTAFNAWPNTAPTPAAAPAPTPDTEIIPASADTAQRLTVPVRVAGQGPYRFLLDTGAQTTVLSHELARGLNLAAGDDVILIGVAGRQQVPTVRLDEIGLGRRHRNGLMVPVLQASDIGADGILGLDSLQDQRVLIDFTHNLVAVDDARALGGDTGFDIVVAAHRKAGQLILANARIDGVRVAVIVDTGADATVGNLALRRALQRQSSARSASLPQADLTSVTGQILSAQLGVARELTLQSLSIANVLIAFADAPPFAHLGLDERPAILLGMHELRLFRRVAIDFSARRILFDLPRTGDRHAF